MLFRMMLTYGVAPQGLLLSTLVPLYPLLQLKYVGGYLCFYV